jgi:hypothetical protein
MQVGDFGQPIADPHVLTNFHSNAVHRSRHRRGYRRRPQLVFQEPDRLTGLLGYETCATRVDASTLPKVVALALEKLPLRVGTLECNRSLGEVLECRRLSLHETLERVAVTNQLEPLGIRSPDIAFEPRLFLGVAPGVRDSQLFFRSQLLFSRARQLRPKLGCVQRQH